jgi:V-type H+-transporting ATPase subunit C
MVYWLVSLPLLQGRRDRTWEVLQEKTSYGQQLSSNSKLEVPELRVGTLDTLMALSDDLVKVNTAVEAIVSKIRRTINDIAGQEAVHSLKVENLPVESYLTRFKWDEPKFPVRRPIKETVEKIGEVMSHIEDELKVSSWLQHTSCMHF